MLKPLICASVNDYEYVYKNYDVNFYVGDGVMLEIPNVIEDLSKVDVSGGKIKMVHAITPANPSEYYIANEKYFPFLKSLGRVGLTVHYNEPSTLVADNLLFNEILKIHFELPDVVFYIENTKNCNYGLFNMVKSLRDLNIEAWILFDTCHLEMESHFTSIDLTYDYSINYKKLFDTFKEYIGAFHISASIGADGYTRSTHGKPLQTVEDEQFFKKLCSEIASVDFNHDVYIIPEVLEDSYDEKSKRKNGIKAYNILSEVVNGKCA